MSEGQSAENDAPNLLRSFTNALDCCGTCAGGVLAQYVRERMADVWDEGFWHCQETRHTGRSADNPYRPVPPEADQ